MLDFWTVFINTHFSVSSCASFGVLPLFLWNVWADAYLQPFRLTYMRFTHSHRWC